MEEQAYLSAWKTRDNAACSLALKELGPRLLGYATRIIGNRSLAEEIVQEALMASFENIDSFEGRSSFTSWLFRITHNKAIDLIRKQSRYISVPDMEGGGGGEEFKSWGPWVNPVPEWSIDVESQIDAKTILKFVRKELDTLPHTQREVLLLTEIQGLSTEDICDVDRKSTRLNSSHTDISRMPSSA